jgi:hypothetical protein
MRRVPTLALITGGTLAVVTAVGLLCQVHPDEPDDRGPVDEDADHRGPALASWMPIARMAKGRPPG